MIYDPLYDLDKGHKEKIYNAFLKKGTLIKKKIMLKHMLTLKKNKR